MALPTVVFNRVAQTRLMIGESHAIFRMISRRSFAGPNSIVAAVARRCETVVEVRSVALPTVVFNRVAQTGLVIGESHAIFRMIGGRPLTGPDSIVAGVARRCETVIEVRSVALPTVVFDRIA